MKRKIPKRLLEIAAEYNVVCIRNNPYGSDYKNYGGSCGNEIQLSDFDNRKYEAISFFHELGHTLTTKERSKAGVDGCLCILSNEGLAWEKAMQLAKKHKFKFDDKTKAWAVKQLYSYIHNESDALVMNKGE